MKLQYNKANNQFFVSIPNSIARLKDWKKGEELEFKEDGKGNLILKKK